MGARNDVGRRGELADVEFNLADHSPEGCDLRLDRNDFGFDSLDGNGTVAHGGGVWIVGHSDLETNFASQGDLRVRTRNNAGIEPLRRNQKLTLGYKFWVQAARIYIH